MLHIYDATPSEKSALDHHDSAGGIATTAPIDTPNTNIPAMDPPKLGRSSSSSNSVSASPPIPNSNQLALPLHIPKNRSTGNLLLSADPPDRSRIRFSFDASAAAAEFDAIARSPIVTDHDNGLGLSGLRRIRQHAHPMRAPTLPSDQALRSPSFVSLPRSVSMISMMQPSPSFSSSFSASSSPSSGAAPISPPSFSEDLNRFPSESLHSFSFAHQSGDLLHNHQAVFKRSVDFMKDRGFSTSSSATSATAGLASAQARASGDVETQNMLDLLARAHLVGANNIGGAGSANNDAAFGPLTGPPTLSSAENVFESTFIPIPRTTSPELLSESVAESVASTSEADSPLLMAKRAPYPREPSVHLLSDERPKLTISASPDNDAIIDGPFDSAESSRTPTNESGNSQFTQLTSPPISRRPSLLLRRTLTDVTPVAVQQRLLDTLAMPYEAPQHPPSIATTAAAHTGGVSPRSMSVATDGDTASQPPLSATSQSFSSPTGMPSMSMPPGQQHPTRWVPAAQAIFTTEAKPPWTIIAANDLACLVFGVTKAEVRKMGILEVVQEERRSWLEKKLLHTGSDDDLFSSSPTAETMSPPEIAQPVPRSPSVVKTSSLLGARGGGITAKLLSKPNSRSQTPQQNSGHQSPQQIARRSQTVHSGIASSGVVSPGSDSRSAKSSASHHHHSNKSRGVLLCGDVVPIQKRNGLTGSASLWVKEKRVGLIWVLEEINEDVATVAVDEEGCVTSITGSMAPIWGQEFPAQQLSGLDISRLVPRISRQGIDPRTGPVDFAEIARRKFYTCRNSDKISIPATVEPIHMKGSRQGSQPGLRISSFPHIAGIIVVSTQTLAIKSSNSVFCGALFGYARPNGLPITQLVPDFDKILQTLVEVDHVHMHDGIVVPEHSFRKASAFLALREGRPDAASAFLRPEGLPARHRDGSELRIDVQMRVVKSEKQPLRDEVIEEAVEDSEEAVCPPVGGTARRKSKEAPRRKSGAEKSDGAGAVEMVYALWITYSRHLHATRGSLGVASPHLSGAATPMHQPSPGQTPIHSAYEYNTLPVPLDDHLDLRDSDSGIGKPSQSLAALISPRLPPLQLPSSAVASPYKTSAPTATTAQSTTDVPSSTKPALTTLDTATEMTTSSSSPLPLSQSEKTTQSKQEATATQPTTDSVVKTPTGTEAAGRAWTSPTAVSTPLKLANGGKAVDAAGKKKTIDDFVILEEMGQGAYGQVKLAQERGTNHRVVIKYVTKKRILMDTWTRDRRLGTVPLEIHVLDYLRSKDNGRLRHPNIVEMEDFFEDDVNYYIEMKPHGLPGMDLFDYIELRTNMEERECRSIFVQVAQAVHHLHTKALVVHRDIKDENVILDGEGNIKLIDFGSAAYIRSGPFDVFVGTIDYAAPEVLAGQPYRGKEQDVWALGILLYTIIYKENPFYSIDEIMDRDLRIPYTVSDDSIDLIRGMLDRDVNKRITIDQVLEHPWCRADPPDE
ncbi:serine threonine-protein kinase ppk6 [Ophiostoma piceae UAMH 11346]|uniref:non-specific serine/threonine protein kinase n=1 Tax=Ophiostoma piceae (strain UAMH 11346) TaxID=1262450 RepID=S3C9T8_OPHP1|nr:serine threonine-protein kinase ppk6 [Ophiostoma piceae UAMH 11346]